MTNKEKAELMLVCGALHDIAEKCNKYNGVVKQQITDVQLRLEGMIGKILK